MKNHKMPGVMPGWQPGIHGMQSPYVEELGPRIIVSGIPRQSRGEPDDWSREELAGDIEEGQFQVPSPAVVAARIAAAARRARELTVAPQSLDQVPAA